METESYRYARCSRTMVRCAGAAALAALAQTAASAAAACAPGAYGTSEREFVVIGNPLPTPVAGQRYLFPDGRRGVTGDPDALATCRDDVATVRAPDGRTVSWPRMPLRETDVRFQSAATTLAGRLIEPMVGSDGNGPLAVMVHGSEKTPALGNVYQYMLAAQGVAAFAYDKRGTGGSGGEYTQNFELLADDAAAAMAQAKSMVGTRYGRLGYFGGSQGGWVAPLAGTRSRADFVAIGFGLVVSPVEEDREQLLDEARRMGLDAAPVALVERLSRATAKLVRSHFAEGYGELAAVKRAIGLASWAATIEGEHSGAMLRMAPADLRRIGRARFDNLELIWDHDAGAVLRRLNAPLLWVLAAQDREAPIGKTRTMLAQLSSAGKPIDAYLFPDTDHGMVEYKTAPDGSRTVTRITDGYLTLLADWMKGRECGPYGRSERLLGASRAPGHCPATPAVHASTLRASTPAGAIPSR